MQQNKEILLGLTTTAGSSWKEKIEEIKKFGVEKIALFPTYLNREQRKELYELLDDVGDLTIPHVHIRDDFELDEMDFLVKRFGAEVFNIHPQNFWPLQNDLSKYHKQIFVENLRASLPSDEDLDKFGGLCVDFAHLENKYLSQNPIYETFIERTKKYTVGCCHVSAILNEPAPDEDDFENPSHKFFDRHWVENLSELDYMKKYKEFLPQYISIELENSLAQQLECRAYLEKILELK